MNIKANRLNMLQSKSQILSKNPFLGLLFCLCLEDAVKLFSSEESLLVFYEIVNLWLFTLL